MTELATTEEQQELPRELYERCDRQYEHDEQQHAIVDAIDNLIGELDSHFRLNPVYRLWESRMKELAALVLRPGSDEVIDEWNGGLSALDYIWDLHGDYSFSSADPDPPKWRALDYYLGRKIEHIWGTGVLVKTSREGEYPFRYAIRVRLRCGTKNCRNRITVYMQPGCHNGAFCYAYDRNGEYQADLRNQWFKCRKCSKK